MNWIEKWTQNIEDMKQDIMVKAGGINTIDDDASFVQRNKTQVYSFLLLGGMTGLFYIVGWKTLFRISGIMFILFNIGNAIALFKGGFKWITSK